MDLAKKARELLDASQPEETIALLLPSITNEPENAELLQLLGEAYLEVGNPPNAYALFEKSAQIDPTGAQFGLEKFLWLGQLAGDRSGLEWYQKGVEGLRANLAANGSSSTGSGPQSGSELTWSRQKLSEALCGMIEIWMTDLCMEPEAETSCERLITEALMVDDKLPETYSVLGSIRISQQRDDDARQALEKSWQLYEQQFDAGVVSPAEIPALIRLAQNLAEVEAYDHVLDITTTINRTDDSVAEAYYLNGLAHDRLRQQTEGREAARHTAGVRDAFQLLLTLQNRDDADLDPEVAQAASEILATLPAVADDEFSDSDEDSDWENIDD